MPKNHPPLTAERLRELLSYDPATGEFVWTDHAWHAVASTKAGSRNRRGYVQICIDLRRYYAHRLAWLYVHGVWPADQLDHINGVRDANWIANLREANHAENAQNRHISPRNTSRYPGVCWFSRTGKWRARIEVNKKQRHLGYFHDYDDAVAARQEAKAALHTFQPTDRT